MKLKLLAMTLAASCVAWLCSLSAAADVDPLQEGFEQPPATAAPRVWWHWMNGNITRDGVQKDLEWMHRIGIGGVQNFDASRDTPQVVTERLPFMTPGWNDVFRYATAEAEQLGLELTIAGSPGWSESGGPWVEPEQAMKKLVWSETRVARGHRFTGTLPRPPDTVGPFQDVPVEWGPNTYAGPVPRDPVPALYRDVAVIAYRLPQADRTPQELHPAVTSSVGALDGSLLWDSSFVKPVHLPPGDEAHPAWIQMDFGHPQQIQSMSVGLQHSWDGISPRYTAAILEASDDGLAFRQVASAYDLADDTPMGMAPLEVTVTFAPVHARYFRLLLPVPPKAALDPLLASLLPPPPSERLVTEFVLHAMPREDHFEQKAGYFLDAGLDPHPTRHVEAADVIDPKSVVDLTSLLQPDGTLRWTPPRGRWAVLRLGYSLLGITNHPATQEATGLEVDKLSAPAVKAYLEGYLGRYAGVVGSEEMGSRGIRAMVNDSYEAGAQNWTDTLPQEFARRRGYDPRPWLPAMTGRIIGSAEATDRFLWDLRRTLGELIAESHYAQITDILHAKSMLHYSESHEQRRAFIGDGMDVKRHVDIPMGAMWAPGLAIIPQTFGDADIRESASVAHLYGQNRVAAESMTAFGQAGMAFAYAPETLKSTADRELIDGLNLFVIHTSAHQPRTDLAPGLTLGPFGQWFTRQETWAEEAAPWVRYLARSSYLLQQGHFVADVLYYYGQDTNITALYGEHLPPVPEGYAFDFANAHALTILTVRNGGLETESGMHYRLLAVDSRVKLMSLDVLQTIARLVRAGAVVVADKPVGTPSLADNADEFRRLADALWGDGSVGEHPYGAGRVLSGQTLEQALGALRVMPDFSFSKPNDDSTVWFVHRHLADGDLYFINNRLDRPQSIEAHFRVSGQAPELWYADSGLIEPASYRQNGPETIVPLKLSAQDAVFVVFRKPSQLVERSVPEPTRQTLGSIEGPWEVHFQPNRGAPPETRLARLMPWNTLADAGIRYFSGTAQYETPLRAPAAWFIKGQHVEIDLGEVKNLAEVMVNGQSAGILWKPPFRADITALLHPGVNQLSIHVTNLWANRLIGDKQPGAAAVAFSTLNPYSADSPLLESGLVGPVRIEGVREE